MGSEQIKLIVATALCIGVVTVIVTSIDFWPFGFLIIVVLSVAWCIGIAVVHMGEDG